MRLKIARTSKKKRSLSSLKNSYLRSSSPTLGIDGEILSSIPH